MSFLFAEWAVFVTVDGVHDIVELFGVTPVTIATFLLSNFVVGVLFLHLAVSVFREVFEVVLFAEFVFLFL